MVEGCRLTLAPTRRNEVTMRPKFASLVLGLAVLYLPPLTHAQGLHSGVWSGTIADPQGNSKSVTYAVSGVDDSLSITLTGPAGEAPVSFTGLRLVADTLLFTWAGGKRGAPLVCKLVRQANGSFDGARHDPDGQEGRMHMVPPPKP